MTEGDAHFGTIARVAPVAIISVDLRGHVVAVNERAAQHLGYEPGELVGRDFVELVHPATSQATFRGALGRVVSGDTPVTSEHLMLRGDGKLRCILWEASRVVDEDGAAIGVVLVGHPHLEMRSSSPDHHARTSAIMDQVDVIMIRSTDLTEMLSDVLGAFLSIFECDRAWLLFPCDPNAPAWHVPMERTVPGWPGALALGEPVPMTPDAAELFSTALATTRAVPYGPSANDLPEVAYKHFGVKSQLVLAVHPKVGRPWALGLHHCSDARVYTDEEREILEAIGRRLGDALSSLIALRDLRLSEARLEELVEARTAELTRVNRDLESFSASVSHDLRAPLRTITSFAQLIEANYADLFDDEGREHLAFVRQGCAEMRFLIEDLLMLARVSSAELKRDAVDLSAIVREMARTLDAESPDRKLRWQIADGLIVHGDHGLLTIVMQNLIENAWKFTSKTESPRIDVGCRDEAGTTVFFVRDNGAGFDMSHAERLFAPLKRLHSKFEFPGSGVGLSTVGRIIERHGGCIWGEGVPNEGATFSFTIDAPKPAT